VNRVPWNEERRVVLDHGVALDLRHERRGRDALAAGQSAFTAAESRIWRQTVESVLATSTGIDALTAAELLLALDSEAAQRAVDHATGDPNPSVRTRAARIAGSQRGAFASTVRRLLEDQSPLVRLYVSEGLLQSERPATLKR
jgi:hypothetical protein